DTPSVSTIDSHAVRQYLATRGDSEGDFDSVLTDILPGEEEPDKDLPRPEMTNFDELVNSMRSENQHTPLPDRHQQFIEFILTGGMDVLLKEIEKSKTDPLQEKEDMESSPDAQASSTFEQLAAEEPPMPTLEESGTVGDLMLGVGDPSFQNVLAMMRGEEMPSEEKRSPSPQSLPSDVEEAFEAFFESQAEPSAEEPESSSEAPPPEMPEVPPTEQEEFAFEPETPPEDEDDAFPAQLILTTALDETSPVESFSLDDLINSIEKELSEHKPDVHPLPSWNTKFKPRPKAEQRYIEEPDFLPEEFPTSRYVPVVEPDEAAEIPRLDEPSEIEETPVSSHEAPLRETWDEEEQPTLESWDTEPPIPPDYLPEETWDEPAAWDAQETWDVVEEEAFDDETELMPVGEDVEELVAQPSFFDDFMIDIDESIDEQTVMTGVPHEEQAPVEYDAAMDFELPAEAMDALDEDDARAAQVALSLTQVSLELTAEATLLTRDGKLIAMDGRLEAEDLDELRVLTADDADVNPGESRVRFIQLSGSGRDYMVYSRRTEADFVLTLIFAPETPLRDIRRQGKRLMQALESVPEIIEQTPPATTPQVVPSEEPVQRAPYAYVWLLRDPNTTFNPAMSQMLMAGLRTQLSEQGWLIQDLQARDEYIYILADVPGERPAYEVIRELKRRTADIARVQDSNFASGTIWADSYLVLTPGRALEQDEIIQFINFERTL
ncbi:MAG: transposase, partial [Anaerolineae bacterium]|nr:transposase [Anaerolineae bacterium]